MYKYVENSSKYVEISWKKEVYMYVENMYCNSVYK